MDRLAVVTDLRRGDRRASAFLINMNEVFERFVWEALRESLGLTEDTFPHEAKGRKLFLDQRKRITLEPDLSWWDRGKCVFVGDAKYKKVSIGGVKNPDIYQMLAYTTAANLPSGLLIYAKGEAPSASHSIPLAGKTIEVRTLDLDGTPEYSLRQIDEIAYEVRRLTQRNRRSAA